MRKNNEKIILSMNTLIYATDLFEKLTELKDDEVIGLATATFSSYNGGKDIFTHVHTTPATAILMEQFEEEIKLLLHKLLSLFDLSCYKENLINGDEYTVAKFFVGANADVIEVGVRFEDFAQNILFYPDFDNKGVAKEISTLLEKIEKECSRMLDYHVVTTDRNEFINQENTEMSPLKPVQNTEDEEGLMFAIEGKEWNLYKGDSNLNDIKNEFINAPTSNDDGQNNYKYIALTNSEDTSIINTLAVTYGHSFIIYDKAVAGKCIYPIKVKELMSMLSELIEHYRGLGYDLVIDEN